jgi:glutamine synthetase
VFLQTVTGDFVDSEIMDDTEPDLILRPDSRTLRVAPWYDEPTARSSATPSTAAATESEIAPRRC